VLSIYYFELTCQRDFRRVPFSASNSSALTYLGIGLLRLILHDVKLSPEDFEKLKKIEVKC